MTEGGEGGPKSDADAAVAYQRAATLGDAESALILGRWYRDGRGVTKSTAQALVWFKRAEELGNGDAKKEIRRLEPGA
jgi:TPR repeat protein